MKGASRMTSSQAMRSLPSAGSFVRQSTSTQIQKRAARIMMPFMPRIRRAKSQGNGLKNDINFSSVLFQLTEQTNFLHYQSTEIQASSVCTSDILNRLYDSSYPTSPTRLLTVIQNDIIARTL